MTFGRSHGEVDASREDPFRGAGSEAAAGGGRRGLGVRRRRAGWADGFG